MRKSTQLIAQIIETGRHQGLTAGDIAARAGISSANLSRIRKSGRFNADTIERLLAAAGCDLRVVPQPQRPKTTLEMVAGKLNAGRRHQIPARELHHLLTKFRPSAAAQRAFSHLVGVIEEIPLDQLHDLVIEGSASLPALRRIADFVGGEGPAVEWINAQNPS